MNSPRGPRRGQSGRANKKRNKKWHHHSTLSPSTEQRLLRCSRVWVFVTFFLLFYLVILDAGAGNGHRVHSVQRFELQPAMLGWEAKAVGGETQKTESENQCPSFIMANNFEYFIGFIFAYTVRLARGHRGGAGLAGASHEIREPASLAGSRQQQEKKEHIMKDGWC